MTLFTRIQFKIRSESFLNSLSLSNFAVLWKKIEKTNGIFY